jgi:hypothetical protein
MKGTELRELLGRLEESPAPEPGAAFAAKLEADLRAMDQTVRADAPRPRRVRLLAAAAPVAALTAAAAAAAATLLPSDPHPRQVRTADPGVTAPAFPTEATPSSMPAPTTVVVAPPWLPAVTAPATPTTALGRAAPTMPTAPAPRPAEHPAPTVVAPHEPVPTTVPPPTTTVPAPETLSLHCTPGVTGGNPIVGCGWSASTSAAFHWYRVWREVQGSSLVIVFQSDNRSTTSYYDQAVQSGTNYYYKVDITDAAGNVIGTSNIVAISCC